MTPLMEGLTALGDVAFLLAFFAVGYWLIERRTFARVFVLLASTVLANSALKAVFQVPRPAGQHLVLAEGWSFPSGHAMAAAAIWPALAFYLARALRERRAEGGGAPATSPGPSPPAWGVWLAAFLLVVGISSSRVYLGVHTPSDVTWGALAGLAMAALGIVLGERPPRPWLRMGADGQAAAVTAAVALVLALLPRNGDFTAAVAGGGLVGFWTGAALARLRFVRYGVRGRGPGPLARRLAVAAVGLGGAFGLRVGLKPLLASLPEWGLPALSQESAHAARYLVIGLWVALVAPRLFVWLGLYRPDWVDERA